jgi:hypothetical protein
MPNLPVSVAEKVLESLNSPPMKDISFPFFFAKEQSNNEKDEYL